MQIELTEQTGYAVLIVGNARPTFYRRLASSRAVYHRQSQTSRTGVSITLQLACLGVPVGFLGRFPANRVGRWVDFRFRRAGVRRIRAVDSEMRELVKRIQAGTWQWIHVAAGNILDSPEHWLKSLVQVSRASGLYLSLSVFAEMSLSKESSIIEEAQTDLLPYLTWLVVHTHHGRAAISLDEAEVFEGQARAQGFRGTGVVMHRNNHSAVVRCGSYQEEASFAGRSGVAAGRGMSESFEAGWLYGMATGMSLIQALQVAVDMEAARAFY